MEATRGMAISLGRLSPGASSNLPGSRYRTEPARVAARCHAGRCSLFGLAPRGVCLARLVAQSAGELLPHRFTLTEAEGSVSRAFDASGLLSVALSRALRPVGVTHHGALRSPDFPPGASPNGDSPSGHPAPFNLLPAYATARCADRFAAAKSINLAWRALARLEPRDFALGGNHRISADSATAN